MKKIFGALKTDSVFMAIVALVCFGYGINAYLDLFLCAVLVAILVINIRDNRLFYTYFALVFFESLFVLPFIGGTFFRVLYLLLAARVVLDIVDKKWVKRDWPTIIIGAVFLITSFLYSISFSRNLSVALNVLSVLYISLSLKAAPDRKSALSRLFTFIAVFALLSGVFGIFRGYIIDGEASMRFIGTIDDPNYSALFYTIGFFAVFGSGIKKRWIRIVIQVLLALFVIATSSITGFGVLMVLLFAWFAVKFGVKRAALVLLAAAILVVAIFFVPLKEDGFLGDSQAKLHRVFQFENPYEEINYQFPNYTEAELYFNRLTSSRYSLSKTYAIYLFFCVPLHQQLFGGNNPVEGPFREQIQVRTNAVSHNTYLDMMYMMGYVFLAVLLTMIGINIVRYYRGYRKTGEDTDLAMVLVMLTVLLFATTISIFPFRYFIAFLLL